jgi:hypothetical protein
MYKFKTRQNGCCPPKLWHLKDGYLTIKDVLCKNLFVFKDTLLSAMLL